MNKIETLPLSVEHEEKHYVCKIFGNIFGNWCISYVEFLNENNYICSVCVEPENEPKDIQSVPSGCFNGRIGNARTLDDAADMILDYLKNVLQVRLSDDDFWIKECE